MTTTLIIVSAVIALLWLAMFLAMNPRVAVRPSADIATGE